ncbi:MAG: VacJ family lipoprotein [Proteobacteria bacterium]|nr:VacJ family lipoprotein [Pseudomonadota bacterium]
MSARSVLLILLMGGLLLPGSALADEEEGALDGFNRAMKSTNRWLLLHLISPATKGYNWIVPKLGQEAIHNALTNLDRPRDIINSLLQAKPRRAGRHLTSFLLNSTFGLGGLLYVSDRVLDDTGPESFNETLGVWGLPPGPYVVLPFYGGTSPRGLTGLGVDVFLHPLFWVPGGTTGTIASSSRTAIGGLNTLALLMPTPWASESEWKAYEDLIRAETDYLEDKQLFYENQQLDVED